MGCYPNNILEELMVRRASLKISNFTPSSFRGKDIIALVGDKGFLSKQELLALKEFYINNLSKKEIAKLMDKGDTTVSNYISNSLNDICYRMHTFLDGYDEVPLRDKSIWSLYSIPYRVLYQLHKNGYSTIGSLKDSNGEYTKSIIASRNYIQNIDSVVNSVEVVEVKEKRVVVLKWVDDCAKCVTEDDEGNFTSIDVLENELDNYIVTDVSEAVSGVKRRDISIRRCKFITKEVYDSLSELGVSNLSDLTKFTRKEISVLRGIRSDILNKMSSELSLRKLGDFKKEITQKVTTPSNRVDYVEDFKSMEDLSDEHLPKKFRLSIIGKCNSKTSDADLLSMYDNFLIEEGREDEWFILQDMITEYSSNVPLGVVNFIEGHKDYSFNKSILKDTYSAKCFKYYVDSLSKCFDNSNIGNKFGLVSSTILDKYGKVNLKDLYDFMSKIEWDMPIKNIIYLYRNYRYDSDVLVSKRVFEGSIKYDDTVLRNSLSYKGILDVVVIEGIRNQCRLLNIPYEYAIEGVSKLLSKNSGCTPEKLNRDAVMLATWFNFDYDAMTIYVSENNRFGQEV